MRHIRIRLTTILAISCILVTGLTAVAVAKAGPPNTSPEADRLRGGAGASEQPRRGGCRLSATPHGGRLPAHSTAGVSMTR